MDKLPRNYCALGEEFSSREGSAIVVLPIPYNATCTWLKGCDKGPNAIIEASANMELYDLDTELNVAEKGIYTAPPVEAKETPEEMVEEIWQAASEYVKKGKFVVGLGGEHSVSTGLVKAQKEEHPDLTVLYLDAHADLRDAYLSGRYDHACTASRIRELCPVVHVGLRSMCEEESEKIEKEKTFFDRDLQKGDWMDRAIGLLGEKVYVSIDLDVFNPSEMPSVGTPEPGGLSWYQVVKLLSKVSEKKVVGFDVVELCPNPRNKAPDFLASKLVYVFLSRIFKTR